MKTADDRLQFALAFAELELDTLREGDWLNLRDDMRTFAWLGEGEQTLEDLGGVITFPVDRPLPQDLTKDNIRALQREAKNCFFSIATFQRPLRFHYLRDGSRDGGVLAYMGNAPDMFLIRLVHLLGTADRIRTCPECNKLFLKIRKQKYCSRTCVNKANQRDWRERKQVQDEEPQPPSRRAKKAKRA